MPKVLINRKGDAKRCLKTKASNKKSSPKTDELSLLKQENNYLRLELAYLKKLQALGLKDPRANNKP